MPLTPPFHTENDHKRRPPTCKFTPYEKYELLGQALFERGRIRGEEVGGIMKVHHGLHDG
jgi:hypothetical protein